MTAYAVELCRRTASAGGMMVSVTIFTGMPKDLMRRLRTHFPEPISLPGLKHLGRRIQLLLHAGQGMVAAVVG
jgi:hypothetical protein